MVADESGDATTIAVDLLAQAEHDVRTRVGLITTDSALAEAVLAEVERQLGGLSTAGVAAPAWRDYGEITLCADEAAMIAYSDHIAAEHLQVHTGIRMQRLRAPQLRLAVHRRLRQRRLFRQMLRHEPYAATMAAGRYTGGLWVGSYLKTCTHQWLDERGVAAVCAARHAPER